jgi:hypothetical protein
MSDDLSDTFRQAINQYSRGVGLDSVSARDCGSDRYDGVEYKFKGNFVPIKPIIDVVAEEENKAIAQMSHGDGGEGPRLVVFVANLSQQDHPAFV